MRKMMQQIADNIKAQAPDSGLAATARLLDAVNPVRGDGLRPLAAEQASYKTGDAVRLVGLTSEKGAQLNGKEGQVVSDLNDRGRQAVMVVGETMRLKPANLRKVEFDPAASADVALPLEDRLRLMVSIMEGNTEQNQYNQRRRLNALLHAVREDKDCGGLSRLSNYWHQYLPVSVAGMNCKRIRPSFWSVGILMAVNIFSLAGKFATGTATQE